MIQKNESHWLWWRTYFLPYSQLRVFSSQNVKKKPLDCTENQIVQGCKVIAWILLLLKQKVPPHSLELMSQ